eukprot:scaffold10.g2472.t1
MGSSEVAWPAEGLALEDLKFDDGLLSGDLSLSGLDGLGDSLDLGAAAELGDDLLCDTGPSQPSDVSDLLICPSLVLGGDCTGASGGTPTGSGSALPPLVASAATASGGSGGRGTHSLDTSQERATPSTSESGYAPAAGVGAAQGGTASSGQRVLAAPQQPQQRCAVQGGAEDKRAARMERNRLNAHLSRQRRKQLLEELQARCAALQAENAQLSGLVARLSAENSGLRQQLAVMAAAAHARHQGRQQQQQEQAAATAGVPAAAAAAPAAVAAAPAPAAAAPVPAAGATVPTAPDAAAAPVGAVAPGASSGIPLPLLPFLFSQPSTPPAAAPPAPAAAASALAPAAPDASAARAVQAAAQDSGRKRRRTGTGAAATAFIAFFSLFMFAQGPLLPGSARPGSDSIAASGALHAITASPWATLPVASGAATPHHGGRALQALPSARGGGERPVRQPPLPGAAAAAPVTAGAGGSLDAGEAPLPVSSTRLAQLLDSTLEALLEQPGNRQAERKALAHLQELAPVALLLEPDSAGGGGAGDGAAVSETPLAASQAFPRLADTLFRSSGLQPPQTCQKVLEFDAATVPGAGRSRRSLERFLLGQHGFRGRSLSLAAGPAQPGTGGEVAGGVALPAAAPLLRLGDDAAGGRGSGGGALPLANGAPDGEAPGAGGDALHALAPGAAAGLTLVSVLLPANASGEGEEGGAGRRLTSVDRVLVVVLEPLRRYVTYSCTLPRAVLV